MKKIISTALLVIVSLFFSSISQASELAEQMATLSAEKIRSTQDRLKENKLYGGSVDGVINDQLLSSVESFMRGVAVKQFGSKEKIGAFVYNTVKNLNNKFEYDLALQKKSKELTIIGNPPVGKFTVSANEGGDFKHIVDTKIWEFLPDGKCILTQKFQNTTDLSAQQEGAIFGRCQLVKWRTWNENELFFWPDQKSGEIWTVDNYFDYLASLKSKGLIEGFGEFKVYGDTIIVRGASMKKSN